MEKSSEQEKGFSLLHSLFPSNSARIITELRNNYIYIVTYLYSFSNITIAYPCQC